MKTLVISLALAAIASSAQADCYADYKAKQDDPLRLHYGVAEVQACSVQGAAAELRPRLAQAGWTLLNVLSTFDASALSEKADSAGSYYLRF